MATAEQVAEVRRMADEPGSGTYTDEALSALYDREASAAGAAAVVWQTKAGQYSKLVNTSESGSSRQMGDLYKSALAMAKYYTELANPTQTPETAYPMTVPIERL